MEVKSGTIGYGKLERGWTKCVVQGQAGFTLVVRVAPYLHGQLLHIEQFLQENKFHKLGFFRVPKFSFWEQAFQKFALKKDLIRCKLKRSRSVDRIILADSVGWAKIYTRGLVFFRKRWRRSLVLKQEKHNLTLCCAPDFSIVKVHADNFLADFSEKQIRIKKYQPHF